MWHLAQHPHKPDAIFEFCPNKTEDFRAGIV